MKSLRQLFVGLITAAGSAVLVLAAMYFSLIEGTAMLPLPPTPAATQTPVIVSQPSGKVVTATPQPPSPTPAASRCKQPRGWVRYTVQDGDTVDALAAKYKITKAQLLKANCMVVDSLPPGTDIFLPKLKTPSTATATVTIPTMLPTITQVPCGPPSGWVIYIVQPGDTLSYLARTLGVSVYQLQVANCLSGDRINYGQQLYVPFLPPVRTPVIPTNTPTVTDTPITPTITVPTEKPPVKQDQTITFAKIPDKVFGDAPFPVNATASSGLPVSFSASGNCSASGNVITISGAGSCTVTASQNGNDAYNAAQPVSQTFNIAKANATVTLGSLSAVYDGSPKEVSVTTDPPGLNVTVTYDGAPTPPTNAGSYTVVATINEANYQGSASGTLVISKAQATVTLVGNLVYTQDGTPKSLTAVTVPANLNVVITYNGSPTPPTEAGTYQVVATIQDNNYEGGATATLVINPPPPAAK